MRVSDKSKLIQGGPRVAGLVLLAALCLPAPGCKKASSGTDMPADSASEAAGDGADTDDPLAELDALEDRMREFGLATASSKQADEAEASPNEESMEAGGERDDAAQAAPADSVVDSAPAPSKEDVGSRCGDLCDLSESICLLEVRICSLSESHATDPIYADACERAVDDCHTAGQACDGCDA